MPKKKKKWQLATWLPRKRKKEAKKRGNVTGNVVSKKKKRKKGNIIAEREREQLEENIGIFVNQEKIHSQSVFSQFWGENILVGPGR